MHKAFNPRDDIDRLYVLRKGGGWGGFVSVEDCVESLIQGLEDYIKKRKVRLLTAANNSIGNIRTNRKKKQLTNLETEMGSKTTVWRFKVTNRRNLTWDYLAMVTKKKPQERI